MIGFSVWETRPRFAQFHGEVLLVLSKAAFVQRAPSDTVWRLTVARNPFAACPWWQTPLSYLL
jgi:hypothetical protein